MILRSDLTSDWRCAGCGQEFEIEWGVSLYQQLEKHECPNPENLFRHRAYLSARNSEEIVVLLREIKHLLKEIRDETK